MQSSFNTKLALAGGVLAGIGGSACCVVYLAQGTIASIRFQVMQASDFKTDFKADFNAAVVLFVAIVVSSF